MQLSTFNSDEVKAWIVKKLENISDADPDVLADYVLALLTSDEPEDSVRKSCLENLEDFLKENTRAFVDEIFRKYGTKPAIPASLPPRPPPNTQHIKSSDPFASSHAASLTHGPVDTSYRSLRSGRKRSFNEQSGRASVPENLNADVSRVHKSRRQDRKGRRLNGQTKAMQQQPRPVMFSPQALPGFPIFDPNDPIAAMMAMQAFMQTFGMPGMGQRCQDYDTKGFCARGASCPFQHGETSFVANGESGFDPNNQFMDLRNGTQRSQSNGRRGHGFKEPHKRHRHEFSDASPNYDKSITTIVVERIPKENLTEEQVGEFFSQYGKVDEVKIESPRQLALVKYSTYKAAKKAYDSPKVVFDNRFIKVYWYKPRREHDESFPKNKGGAEDFDTMELDPETFARQQEKAQKNYEERMARLKTNAEARRQLYEQQQAWKEKNEAEMKELLSRIEAAESKRPQMPDGMEDLDNQDASLDAKYFEKAKVQMALREQLALLEAEAKSLGIDPDAPATPSHSSSSFSSFSGRGRASYRGGRSATRARGAFGTFRPQNSIGSVLRLDNRPKRIAISLPTGSIFDADKDEALRHYLIGISEFESIEQDSDQPPGQGMIVTYAQRYQADMLVARGKQIPGVGTVDMKWIANTDGHKMSVGDATENLSPSSHDNLEETKRRSGRGDEDEDMADDDDDDDEGELHIRHEEDESNTRTVLSSSHLASMSEGTPAEVNYDVASDDDEVS